MSKIDDWITKIPRLKNAKVSRFSYKEAAYTNDDIEGVENYDYTRDMNVPSLNKTDTEASVLDSGARAQFSSLSKNALNHFFGRVSYNLNKVIDFLSDFLDDFRVQGIETVASSVSMTLPAYYSGKKLRLVNTNTTNAILFTFYAGQTFQGSNTVSIPAGRAIDIELFGTTWKDSLTGNLVGSLTGNVTGNVTGDLVGNVTGNADTATNATNADTADKWKTARNISISDADGTNTGSAVSVDGSENETLKLPATIKANITGNAFSATSTIEKYMHISFDDVEICLNNLINNTYNSLFEEPFFAFLKTLHDTYDAKFSLYVFLNTWVLMPLTYAQEFTLNSNWLKIGLHSTSSSETYKEKTRTEGMQDWNTFVNATLEVCGSADCIDRCPRLHCFEGSPNAIAGMQFANYGAVGLLSADDDRPANYFLSKAQREYLYNKDSLTDEYTNIVFIRTDMRGDWFNPSFSTTYNYHIPTQNTVYEELEYRYTQNEFLETNNSLIWFTHEWQIYNGATINSYGQWVIDACKFSKDYRIPCSYPQLYIRYKENSVLKENNAVALRTTNPLTSLEFSLYKTYVYKPTRAACMVFKKDLSQAGGAAIGTGSYIVPATGRAASENIIDAGIGGKTVTIVQNISGVTLYMSIVEYFDDNIITPQSVNRNGQVAAEWISASVILQADTRYIGIAFIRDDAKSSFTADEPLILPTCFSIT